MASIVAREPSAFAGWSSSFRLEFSTVVVTLVTASVALVVLSPIVLLVLNSFRIGALGDAATWGLGNWQAALNERQMRDAVINTLTLCIAGQAVAFLLAVPSAFLLARTDIPFKKGLEFCFWISVFLPGLTVTLGWILLLDGNRGLLNRLLLQLPFVENPPFDIFSWGGIVFLHAVTISTAIKVVLLVPAFRNMNSALEEASYSLGASPLRTFLRIMIPIMAPTVLVVLVIGLIRSLQSFEIELILGAPRQIEVYSTLIYHKVLQEPPQYGHATVLSVFALIVLLPLIAIQQWASHRRNYATVSGKFATRILELGRWRWPLFAALVLLCVMMTVVPFAMVLMGTFMRLFGFFSVANAWTLDHWKTVLGDPQFLRALGNTLAVGVGAAAVAVVAFPLIAYIAVRTRTRARGVLDFVSWLPSALPGIVIGLGFLWVVLGFPVIRLLYGTSFVLIAAVALGSMAVGVQILKGNLLQLGNELEEASRAHGASWPYTFVRILLPLSGSALVTVVVLAFGSSVREVSLIALLTTRTIEPLSIYQLLFVEDGNLEKAAVIGVVIMMLSLVVTLLGWSIGMLLSRKQKTAQ
jgi:iron(III) transport system permease protein